MKFYRYIPLVALLGLFFASPVYAVPTYVQSTSTVGSTIATNTSTASYHYVSNVTAGDLLPIYVRWQANGTTQTSTISSVTDTQGDIFVPAFPAIYDASATPAVGMQVWYAVNSIGGNSTATVTFSTSTNGNGVRMGVFEYSGIATSSALDDFSTSLVLTPSTTFNSNPIGTNFANELLFGGFSAAGSSHNCTAGTGYTKREPNAVATVPYCVEDRIVSATGTYQATGTYSATADFASFIVGFSASSTAPTPGPDVTSSVLLVQGALNIAGAVNINF